MTPIFDLHCHPSLKIYLCGHKIYRPHPFTIPGFPIGMEVDLPGMNESNVKVAFCSHYVPESGFRHLPRSQWLFDLLVILGLPIMDKFEEDDDSEDAYNKMLSSMQDLELQIDKARKKGFKVTIAKNWKEFITALENGETIVVHSAEGSHQLGRNLSATEYIKRLADLKAKGLALLTIAHFFPNDICDSGGGIPYDIASKIGYTVPPPKHYGLSPAGREIIHWCQEEGMIVDLMHCSTNARKQVFELLDERKGNGQKTRPVVLSHSGVRDFARDEGTMTNPDDLMYLPSLDELRELQKHKGVLGLILYDYWITGDEKALNRKQVFQSKQQILDLEIKRINDIVRLIRYLKTHIPCFENNIAFGTDMDGFTHVPNDIRHIRFIKNLRTKLEEEFEDDTAKKVCNGNMLRVVEAAWS